MSFAPKRPQTDLQLDLRVEGWPCGAPLVSAPPSSATLVTSACLTNLNAGADRGVAGDKTMAICSVHCGCCERSHGLSVDPAHLEPRDTIWIDLGSTGTGYV